MAHDAFNPFETLGLPRDASERTIKATYRALAFKYHPNRQSAPDESKTHLSELFHLVYRAYRLLIKADSRRRCLELLDLLDLQDEVQSQFIALLTSDTSTEPRSEQRASDHASDHDGHVSSDADEDLPNVGIKRRQTDLKRGAKHLGDVFPRDRSTRPGRARPSDLPSMATTLQTEQPKHNDYFSMRRKKLKKLRQKETEAFFDYRNAMIAKLQAEELADRLREEFEEARWKREYFERSPKEMSERMQAFRQFMGVVKAFNDFTVRPNRLSVNYGSMSPTVGSSENQFLFPEHALARRKSIQHRRGWSSDISGDQESSDDDSVDTNSQPRRISPPSRWNRNPVKAKDSIWAEWHDRLQSRPDVKKEAHAPFQYIVKRPTDLAKLARSSHHSSPDSNSDPSRPPSPRVAPESSRYTWLQYTGTANLFDISDERHARSTSPSGHHRSSLSQTTDRDGHNSSTELCRFAIKNPNPSHVHGIPIACVHVLSHKVKARLLAAQLDSDVDPETLLDRLNRLDPRVASKFMVKPDAKEEFNFRLIYSHPHVKPDQQKSFIALSYRRKLHVERQGFRYTLPLDPEVFQAVWDERESESEGVWIDQICIDQESDREKTVSMSAMDMVYRSARLIVVALDDIELGAEEGKLLQRYMDQYAHMTNTPPGQRNRRKEPPYLETHDDLFQLIRKLLHSSWFRRAWCRHEMRLAKNHIFLIPCKNPGSLAGRDVLRFNGKCIDHLLALSTEVPFEREVEMVKPALHAFFRDRSRMSAGDKTLRHHHGNFTTVVAEVFEMEAGGDPRIPEAQRQSDARKDMVSIVLNTMECGLALDGRLRDPGYQLSLHDCYHDLLLLALAAQDPAALCSVGAPLRKGSVGLTAKGSHNSWMHTPTAADSGLNNFKTLQRFSNDTLFRTGGIESSEFIQLDLLFFPHHHSDPTHSTTADPYDPLSSTRSTKLSPHSPTDTTDSIKLARHFMRVCEEKKWGRNRKRYLTHDSRANNLFGSMNEVYVETLACVFECGPDWMSDICQRYRMSRWKAYLRGAYELLIALQNTHGNWPVREWNDQAAGFIMDFVTFLVIRGMPSRQLTQPEKWRPIWVQTNTETHGKVLTFIPVGNENFQFAVPTALARSDYVELARLWALEPIQKVSEGDENTEWLLLGKSVLFSDEQSIEEMKLRKVSQMQERMQQKVHGRQRLISTGALRG